MSGLATLTAVTEGVVLVFGGGITLFAYRAARRTGSDALRLFAVGFATVTAGALLGGMLNYAPGIGPHAGVLLGNLFIAVGFAVLGYSLYAEHGDSPAVDPG